MTKGVLLDFRDRYGLLIADFDTALASQALLGVNRNGFLTFHLEDVHGAYLDTFFTPFTFAIINRYVITHLFFLLIF
jgi:hypothetical protein